MSRSLEDRIADILVAIERCSEYIELINEQPELMKMGEEAIERNLQIIGEATKTLPSSVTEKYPDIPWPQIRGFRNILVHEYFGVEINIVREVVEEHLPHLAVALQEHLSES